MIDRLDHIVLTVRNLEATIAFYVDVLGMQLETFKGDRKALKFGAQKFNLHVKGHEFEPKAAVPTPGAIDLCLITKRPIDEVQAVLRGKGVAILEGPIERTGATGRITSVYVRDPDENLIEISNYLE